jgi:hypothetical protein
MAIQNTVAIAATDDCGVALPQFLRFYALTTVFLLQVVAARWQAKKKGQLQRIALTMRSLQLAYALLRAAPLYPLFQKTPELAGI